VLAMAFCHRELSLKRRTEVDPPNQNSAGQKFVAAKCRNQHATGVRSPNKTDTTLHENRYLWPND
jgi:hypothetical protein